MNDDGENVKYCSTHGLRLDTNLICSKCAEQYCTKELSSDIIPGQKSLYFINELRRNNETPWVDKYWAERSEKITVKYFCDSCKFFNYHQMIWCPLCGGEIRCEKLTYNKLAENYANYRVGI